MLATFIWTIEGIEEVVGLGIFLTLVIVVAVIAWVQNK